MKSKNHSIIISLFIVITLIVFVALSVISIATPNLAKEIEKDLNKGIKSLCLGDIHEYYNMYNTRKLTEIEKSKFYEQISETQEIVNSEMDLFKKYKLTIKINDVSIINKINDNLFLCNLNVNYKYRKKHDTTATIDKTEDYIVKIIDVGNMEYKILLPFNSLDKDFSSSNLYKKLLDAHNKKLAEKIKKEREEQNTTSNEEVAQEEILDKNTNINDNFSNTENIISENDNTIDDNSQENIQENTQENENTFDTDNSSNSINETSNSNATNNDKSSFESFLEQ